MILEVFYVFSGDNMDKKHTKGRLTLTTSQEALQPGITRLSPLEQACSGGGPFRLGFLVLIIEAL